MSGPRPGQPKEASIRVAVLQGPDSGRSVAHNLAAIEDAARRAKASGADLLVTPEMSVTGYAIGPGIAELARARDGEHFAAVSAIAREHAVAVVYGYPERDADGVYNAVCAVGADGAPLAHYRKTHLYGELDRANFRPGHELPTTFLLGGVRCGLLICYDVEFPEAVRAHADAGVELLVVPTGLMRPFELIADHVVVARAYESQLYVVYANRCGAEGGLEYTGLSTAVAPDGSVLARAGRGEELLFFAASGAEARRSRDINTLLADRRADLYPAREQQRTLR